MSTNAIQSQTLRKLQTGHVGLNVSDLARSTKFYQDVFGFQAALSPSSYAFPFCDTIAVIRSGCRMASRRPTGAP